MATVPGIDVSYWTAGIDWPKVRATGQRFVLVKATEGEMYVDPTFDDNWSGSKSVGLLRGPFHFFRCNADPVRQANNFINAVKAMNEMGELPPAIDLETNDGQANERIITRAKTWLDMVEAAFGKKPMIYSGYYFLRDYFSQAGGGPPAWTKDYPLWLAEFPNTYTPGTEPPLPRGWFSWKVWQYSDKGHVNGVNDKVDLDVFNGTLQDLYQFAGVAFPEDRPFTYIASAGDTLESVASKYGLTLHELLAANPQLLEPGASLSIPAGTPIDSGGSPPPAYRTYTVAPGDTLTSIAIKFGTTVAAIASLNNIQNINVISVGQVLKIP